MKTAHAMRDRWEAVNPMICESITGENTSPVENVQSMEVEFVGHFQVHEKSAPHEKNLHLLDAEAAEAIKSFGPYGLVILDVLLDQLLIVLQVESHGVGFGHAPTVPQ